MINDPKNGLKPALIESVADGVTPPEQQAAPLAFKGSSSDPTSVLFVNRSYWPDMEATGQLLTELCQSLAENPNYEVSVLCGQPNFNDGNVEFKKYGVQQREGVSIRRTCHTVFEKSKFIGRAVNFVSFCCSAFLSLLFGKRPDVIVCQTDPPLAPIAACLVAFLRRTKFVCYLQDIYPDIAVECGKLKEGFAVKVLRKFLVWCYCRADQIVVVSDDMRGWLKDHGVDESKVLVIHNWVDTNVVFPVKTENAFRQDQLLDGKLVVMYSGNVGQTQRFDMVLDAAERLRQDESIVFMVVGSGARLANVQAEANRRGLSNVRFLPYQPKSELAVSLSAADIQLVLLDQRMTGLMMPSKLYSALASGTPIVGIGASDSHLARIVVDNDCGWFFGEDELDRLLETLREAATPGFLSQKGRLARELAVSRFCKRVSVGEFVAALDAVTGQQSVATHDIDIREAAEEQRVPSPKSRAFDREESSVFTG